MLRLFCACRVLSLRSRVDMYKAALVEDGCNAYAQVGWTAVTLLCFLMHC